MGNQLGSLQFIIYHWPLCISGMTTLQMCDIFRGGNVSVTVPSSCQRLGAPIPGVN
jgi:hypothetical protein